MISPSRALRVLITLSLLIFLLSFITIDKILTVFGTYPATVIFTALFTLAILLFSALRFRTLESHQQTPLRKLILVMAAGFTAADLSPGKIGDFTKLSLLQNGKTKIGLVLIERFLDAAAVTLLGLIAVIFWFINPIIPAVTLIGIIISLSFAIAIFLLIRKPRKLSWFPFPEKWKSVALHNTHHTSAWFSNPLSKKRNSFAAALAIWAVNSLKYSFLLYLLTGTFDYSFLIFIALITPLSWLPISIGGIGVLEGAAAILAAQLSYAPEIGITIVLTDRIFNALIYYSLGGYAWLQYSHKSSARPPHQSPPPSRQIPRTY